MSTTAPTSRQGRAYGPEEVHELLRDALATLMADGTPFRDISVERLVSTAGMARSTFYVYFEDKSAMLRALSAASLKRFYAAQRAWLAKGRDVKERDIRDGMRRLFDVWLEDEAVLRAVAEAAVYDPAIGDAYTSCERDYARAIERFIRRGQKDGWVAAGLSPADTAAALAWMTERTVSQVAPSASPGRLDSAAESLMNIVSSTLFR